MQTKFNNLKNYISQLEKQGLCLAFSGGIDSTVLLYLCQNTNVIAVTLKSSFQTKEEIELTQTLCKIYNIKQKIIEFYPLKNKYLTNNPKDRCYHCKKLMFSELVNFAKENNFKHIIDGTNFDDLGVYRPGLKALKELNIISPLAKFEITKQEIRTFAKLCKIETFNKPSTPCLATRFPYGTPLTEEKLKTVSHGENILKTNGFDNCRLRIHNDIARLEIPQEKFEEFLKKKDILITDLKTSDIKYITLDIEGLRSGSMD